MKLLLVTILSIPTFIYSQVHKGNNFELSNKSDQPLYFSLSDPAQIFKITESDKPEKPDKSTIDHFIKPTSYLRAPEAFFLAPLDLKSHQGKLITLKPDQSIATYVTITKPVQLVIARGKSPMHFTEIKLYRFTPNKTLYLKVDKQNKLMPQEGILKPTLKGLKRFARSSGSLEYNVTPEDIKTVKTITSY